MMRVGRFRTSELGYHIGRPVLLQQELGVRQLDDALHKWVPPRQDKPMPVLLGMKTGSKEGMDRGAIEECDLTQIQHDRLDIGPFEMPQAV
jgi:hypothetical protein